MQQDRTTSGQSYATAAAKTEASHGRDIRFFALVGGSVLAGVTLAVGLTGWILSRPTKPAPDRVAHQEVAVTQAPASEAPRPGLPNEHGA